MSPHKHREADDTNPELPGPESARLVPERTPSDEKIQKLAAALRGEEWLIQQCQRVLNCTLRASRHKTLWRGCCDYWTAQSRDGYRKQRKQL